MNSILSRDTSKPCKTKKITSKWKRNLKIRLAICGPVRPRITSGSRNSKLFQEVVTLPTKKQLCLKLKLSSLLMKDSLTTQGLINTRKFFLKSLKRRSKKLKLTRKANSNRKIALSKCWLISVSRKIRLMEIHLKKRTNNLNRQMRQMQSMILTATWQSAKLWTGPKRRQNLS